MAARLKTHIEINSRGSRTCVVLNNFCKLLERVFLLIVVLQPVVKYYSNIVDVAVSFFVEQKKKKKLTKAHAEVLNKNSQRKR